jgi:regulatory protein
VTGATKAAVQPDDVEAAMKRAMRLLAVRARSCHEIRDRLLRAGFNESAAQAAELRLVNVGLLDDAVFASQVVRRGAETGKSSRLTRRELQRFGVGADVAEDTLAGVDEDEADEERALQLAETKAATCRQLPPEKAVARVVRHLLSKGYGPQLAWEVTRKVFNSLEIDGD